MFIAGMILGDLLYHTARIRNPFSLYFIFYYFIFDS